MEEQPTPVSVAPPDTTQPMPIVDVKAPPPKVADVVPEPAITTPNAAISPSTKLTDHSTPAKKPGAKSPAKGVNVAIVATVVIVLGLAVLAVYAYLKTR